MYRIAILEKDKAYRKRLILFLQEHHGESFEITVLENLDALDMEVMQCSALFFGDDVPVDDALFPEEVAVGYLTENDEKDEQHINKYQSMEQIYKRMLRLCEDKNAGESGTDPQEEQETLYHAETVTEGQETYRVYHIPEEQLDRLAVKMLAGNRIKGLPQTAYHDGRLKVRITGMESLSQYLCRNTSPRDKEKLLAFFADMITTALSLEEYMLSMDRLLLDSREIYVSPQASQVFIPYIPVQCDEVKDTVQCLEEINALCSALLKAAEASHGDGAVPQDTALEDIESGEAAIEETETEPEEDYGTTEEFDRLQKYAKESLELREGTKSLSKEKIPCLVRKRTGERIVINRTLFKLGKDASYVDYCIKDNPAVSRNHADILRKTDGYYLVDKGSLNHTFVNGKKLAVDEYRKLEDGCLVQLADEVFEFGLKG